jgi:xyloglucan:xyloglucosyl transferase
VCLWQLKSYTNNHDELDFEFLGGKGQNYLLQTNVFTNGQGDREQRISL